MARKYRYRVTVTYKSGRVESMICKDKSALAEVKRAYARLTTVQSVEHVEVR